MAEAVPEHQNRGLFGYFGMKNSLSRFFNISEEYGKHEEQIAELFDAQIQAPTEQVAGQFTPEESEQQNHPCFDEIQEEKTHPLCKTAPDEVELPERSWVFDKVEEAESSISSMFSDEEEEAQKKAEEEGKKKETKKKKEEEEEEGKKKEAKDKTKKKPPQQIGEEKKAGLVDKFKDKLKQKLMRCICAGDD